MFNKAQEEAIKSENKRILILAGAGTGKTSVVINRIVKIIQEGTPANQIVATTFTNKAAKELLTRLSLIIGEEAKSIYCGTFHKISAQILRKYSSLVSLEPNFQLLTEDDQKRIIKNYLKSVGSEEKPKVLLDKISQYKETGKTKDDILFIKTYEFYQKTLKENNFLDYSDLIQKAVDLFANNEDANKEICSHLLVDEYQDINGLQYKWIKNLSKDASLFCVGDEDQSIYAFRGANIKYIQSFQEDFQEAKIIKLEENYRSCSQILRGAVNVISKNRKKYIKNLISANETLTGFIKVNKVFNEYDEAAYIAKKVIDYQKNYPDYTIGVLVRTNLQLLAIEQALVENNIKYKLSAGKKFYDKKEILDLISYLRAINSAEDFLAFSRIINTPKRGIGEAKQSMFLDAMKSLNCGFENALIALLDQLPKAVSEKCKIFLMQIKTWRALLKETKPIEVLKAILKDTKYIELEDIKEMKNIDALKDHLKQYEVLSDFLENLQFTTEEEESNEVQIMTMHGAKGLEFDIVIAPGWEENIFPSMLSKTTEELEEERRLAYVTITRAKRFLDILYTTSRRINGKFFSQIPSRFIFEL
ncbi:ATP-dependent helicase [Alphaproteobacteria bacterium endosymbiont of Tiliacea citrago]|uniref:ATP-dependent helicase n=1 Tax=Alphaproteobacteria bacterium endosymbiont of Tiliacea citrago TaxID=3077944 RepID=UPI00313AA5C2